MAEAVIAAATLGGAILSSRSNNKATKARRQSEQEALAAERERDAQERADREKDRAMAQAAHDAEQARIARRQAMYQGLLRSRGITIPDYEATPYDPSGATTTSAPSTGGGYGAGGRSLVDLYSVGAGPSDGMSPGVTAPDPALTINEFFRRRQSGLDDGY